MSFITVHRPSTVNNVIDRVNIIICNVRRNLQQEPDDSQTRNLPREVVVVERNVRRLDGVLDQTLFRRTCGEIASLFFEVNTKLMELNLVVLIDENHSEEQHNNTSEPTTNENGAAQE